MVLSETRGLWLHNRLKPGEPRHWHHGIAPIWSFTGSRSLAIVRRLRRAASYGWLLVLVIFALGESDEDQAHDNNSISYDYEPGSRDSHCPALDQRQLPQGAR